MKIDPTHFPVHECDDMIHNLIQSAAISRTAGDLYDDYLGLFTYKGQTFYLGKRTDGRYLMLKEVSSNVMADLDEVPCIVTTLAKDMLKGKMSVGGPWDRGSVLGIKADKFLAKNPCHFELEGNHFVIVNCHLVNLSHKFRKK